MKSAIVDERISTKCERALLLQGFNLIKMKAARELNDAVKSHPDILMFVHENNIITSAEYCESFPYIFSDIRDALDSSSFTFTSDVFEAQYPGDALFNALVIQNKIFMKTDSISDAVKAYADERGLKTVKVKQGYPACTVLAFGASAITSDNGMATVMRKEGIKVTVIDNGDISLPPHEYGFIGGACGVYGKEVFFLGDYKTHRNAELIESAILAEGFTPVSLSDEGLFDLGRIIFLD